MLKEEFGDFIDYTGAVSADKGQDEILIILTHRQLSAFSIVSGA
jgi:hypothetical protein